MMTPDLAAYLRTLPDRCPACLMAPAAQGHAPGCTTVLEPDLPPLEWSRGLTCLNWKGDRGAVCGATEDVRWYLPGPRCPACTPEALGVNPLRVYVPPPRPVTPPEPEPEDTAEADPEPDLGPAYFDVVAASEGRAPWTHPAADEPAADAVPDIEEPPGVWETADPPEPIVAAAPEPEPEPAPDEFGADGWFDHPNDPPPMPGTTPAPVPTADPPNDPPPTAMLAADPEPPREEPMPQVDMSDDEPLFEHTRPPAVSLADKFAMPPMSVLDRRSGDWMARRRRWLSLGMQSEVGRDARAIRLTVGDNPLAAKIRDQGGYAGDGVSVFDPVLCELTYRWHTREGDAVLDPFAGGSVRGVTASLLHRRYTGIELRPEQVAANVAQRHLGSEFMPPDWVLGDSNTIPTLLPPAARYDLVFTCPPYGDLEVYSDDPRDLSTMTYEDFLDVQGSIITRATERLLDDRFAVWVTSDIRDKRGAYRGLIVDTTNQFRAAGLTLHNEAILVDPFGTAAVRAERPFRATRKLTRVHQVVLVFVKGDARRAADRLESGQLLPDPAP